MHQKHSCSLDKSCQRFTCPNQIATCPREQQREGLVHPGTYLLKQEGPEQAEVSHNWSKHVYFTVLTFKAISCMQYGQVF